MKHIIPRKFEVLSPCGVKTKLGLALQIIVVTWETIADMQVYHHGANEKTAKAHVGTAKEKKKSCKMQVNLFRVEQNGPRVPAAVILS